MILVSAAAGLSACAGSPSVLDPHSPEATRISWAAWVLFAVAGAVCLFVIGMVLYTTLRRQPALGPKDLWPVPSPRPPDHSHGTVWIVGGGIVFPVITLGLVLALGVATLNSMPTHAAPGDLVIQVIGHQWWWEVRYPAQDFATANELHVPVGQQVALELSTADVIHSFWVPQLAGKLDLIPGQNNTLVFRADQPGTYRGQCAEFCGVQHALMAMLVVAEPPDQFNQWAAGQSQNAAQSSDPQAQQGELVFLSEQCVYCHTVRGTSAHGQIGPDLTHVASRQTLAAVTVLNTTGNLGGWVIDPQGVKPGNHMPHTDLSSQQLQLLLAYVQSLK